MQVTLSANDGVLTLSQTTGLTFVNGSNGTSTFTFNGTESDINAALEGMTFTPNADFNGSVTLNVTTALAADLVGRYTFEGNANDVAAGTPDNGTLTNGASIVNDPTRGDVLSLNNTNQYVEISGMFGNPADVTLAAWVNVNSGTFADEIISLGDNVALRSVDGANGLTFIIRGTSGWQSVNTNVNISDAGWTHVAATVNDATGDIAIYINGELVATDTAAESIQYTQGTNTRIGENGNGLTHPMDGLIDDARIYARALTAEEIAALATDQAETSDNVAITVDAVNDQPTFNNLDGNSTFVEDSGTPVVLDANVTYFDIDIDRGEDNYDGVDLTLVRNGGANADDVFSAGGNLVFQGNNDLDLSGTTVGTVTTNSGGTLVLTFNATATEAQVNEVLQSIAYSNTNDTPPASVQIDWSMDDSNGGSQGSGGNQFANGNTTVNVTAVNDIVVANTDTESTNEGTAHTFDPRTNDNDAEGDTLTIVDVGQGTNGTVVNNGDGTVTYTPTGNYNGPDSFEYVVSDSGSGLQHYWGLDGDAVDSVGGADGTVNGTTTVAGDVGNGLQFNESNTDYVALPDLTYNTEFTISFEFKVDEINGSLFQYLYSHGDINSTNSINIFINEDAHGSDPNVLRTVVRDSNDTLDNTALQVDISGTGLNLVDSQFHTYTLTVDSDGARVYIDGALAASDATRGADGVNPTGNAYLGIRQDLNNDRAFGGVLDSVQVYDNALSDGQISDIEAGTNRGTVNMTVDPVNDAPTIVNLGGDTLNYDEGDGVVVIDQSADALVADIDSGDFDTGSLTVSFETGSENAEDVLAIANQGTGSGQIGISGSNVSYEGTVIGTFTGGSSGSDLVITFDANANDTAVSALIQAITYENTNNDDPSTSTRTVRYVLTDGDGGTSANYDTTVAVTGVNDPAAIGTNTGANVNEGGSVVITNAMLNEADPDDSGAGVIYTLRFDTVNGTVFVNGNPLGPNDTFTQADIDAGLVVYQHAGAQKASETVRLTIVDGGEDGAMSSNVDFVIAVTDVNDDPVAADDPAGTVVDVASDADTIGFYRLGESTGTTATDETGTNDGTYNNVTLGAAGVTGGDTAADFSGSNSYVNLGNLDVAGSGITMAAWINVDNFGGQDGRIFSKSDGTAAVDHTFMLSTYDQGGNNYVRLRLSAGGYTETLIAQDAISMVTGQWYHVAATYDQATGHMAIYLNGQQVEFGRHTVGGAVDQDPSRDVWIGGNPTGGNFLDGRIDEAILMQRAMSASEIASLAELSAPDYSLTESATINVNAANGLLQNDSDVDGDTLTVTEVNGVGANVGSQIAIGAGGLLTVNADGSFDFDTNGQYENIAAGASVTETFTYTVNDGNGGTDTATGSITINGENDLPVADLNGSDGGGIDFSDTFNEGDSPVSIVDTDATITDIDSPNYDSLGINLGGFNDGTDELIRINGVQFQSGVSLVQTTTVGSTLFDLDFDGTGFTITRSGGGTIPQADLQALLRLVTYENTSSDPTTGNRTFTVVPQDDQSANASPAAFSTITVSAVNDVPTIVNLDGDTLAYDEGDGAVVIEQGGNAVVSDVDSSDFDGGTLTVTISAGGDSAEDVLSIRNQGTGAGQVGVSGSNVTFSGTVVGTFVGGSSGTPLTITWNASSTPLAVTQVVQNITYENTDILTSTGGARTVDFVVTDGDGGTSLTHQATVNVSSINNAPTIANLGGDTLSYNEGDGQQAIEQSGDALVADVDSANFDTGTLTVSFTAGSDSAEDVLSIINTGTGLGEIGVSGSNVTYEGTTIGTFTGGTSGSNLVITLNPNADAVATSALVEAISYENTDTTDPTNGDRAVRFVLTDGDGATSANYDTTVSFNPVNDAPIASVTNGVVAFTENGGQVSLFSGASVDTVEAGQSITQVVVTINSLVNGSNEQLIVDGEEIELTNLNSEITTANGYDVNVSVNGSNEATVTITKSGDFSEVEAETLLNGLAYNNTSDQVADGVRLATFVSITDDGGTANGGDDSGSPGLATLINVNAVNDASQLVGPSIVSNGDFNSGLTGWTAANNVDHDGTQARFGQIGGPNGTLSQTLTTEIGKTYVVTFDYGDASVTKSQTMDVDIVGSGALLDVSLTSGIAENTLQTYQYTFVADATSTTITFSDTSDDHSGVRGYLDNVSIVTDATSNAAINYTENDGAVVIDGTLDIEDVDDVNIESAVIEITSNYANGEDVLTFVDQNGISGSWNLGTGRLTLTGTATIADYETALRSITYTNTSEDPSTATRTVSFAVNDGDIDSNTQTRDINVSKANDAPIITDGPDTSSLTETDSGLTDSGTLTVSDIDQADTVTAAVDSVSVSGTGSGSVPPTLDNATLLSFLTVSPTAILDNTETTDTLAWDFNSGAEAFDFLADGETLVLTYTVSATDDAGIPLSDTETVTVTITGTNDAPVITGGPDTSSLTESDAGLTDNGSFTVSDSDLTDVVSASVDSVTVGGTGVGSVPPALDNPTLLSFLSVSPTAILDGTETTDTLNWNFNSGSEAFDFLGTGETLILTYTVSATDDDGTPLSDTETVTVTITGTSDAPVESAIEGTTLAYDENDGQVQITNTIAITDLDDANIDSAVIQITGNYVNGEDELSFADTPNITGVWNAGAGTLTLTGSDTLANYEIALRSITYENTSDDPSNLTRTVSFIVNDGDVDSNTLTRDIDVLPSNDAPNESGIEGTNISYNENAGQVQITNTLAISDVDDTNIESAVVQISGNYVSGEDILAFSNTANITGVWNAGAGTLTLTGSDTLANYEAALRSVTYENTNDDPSNLTRTVSFIVNDGDVDSNTLMRDIDVLPSNDAPVESAIEGTNVSYNENAGQVQITNTLAISDVDDTNIESAVVQVSGNYAVGEDVLAFTNTANITGVWNAGAGTLTLTGSDTLANYEAALRSVTYENTNDNPSSLTRTISFTVNDGDVDSNTLMRDIDVLPSNDAPVESAIEGTNISYNENAGQVQITNMIAISDVDDTNIESAVVQVSGNYAVGEDVLAFTNTANITGVWNSGAGTLTLTGSDTLANYEAALRSITYENTSDDPSTLTRTVSFIVNDGDVDSNTLTRDIDVLPSNDAPVQSGIEGANISYNENAGQMQITNTIAISDVDDTNIESAVVQITGNYSVGEDVLAFTNTTNITGVWNAGAGTLTLTGGDTLANYEAALRSVTYENTSDDPSTLTRTVSFTVNDGNVDSNTLTRDIDVFPSNDAPTNVSLSANTIAENATDGTSVGIATGSDPDSGDVLSYYLQNDAGGRFDIDVNTGELTVENGSLIDFETSQSHVVRIRVEDLAGASFETNFTINVTDVNETPVGSGESYQIQQLDSLSISAPGLLANDVDPEGTALTVSLDTSTSSGTLVVNSDGTFTYTPNASFIGTDQFTYRVSDGVNTSAPITVTIQVTALPIGNGNNGGGNDGGNDSSDPNGEGNSSDTDSRGDATTPPTSGLIPQGQTSAPSRPNANASSTPSSDTTVQETDQAVETQEKSDDEEALELARYLARNGNVGIASLANELVEIGRIARNAVIDTPLSLFGAGASWSASSQEDGKVSTHEIVIGTTKVVSSALTVGYVVWMVRGGALVASLVAALPAWASFDPLPILGSKDSDDESDDSGRESLSDLIDQDQRSDE